MYYKVVAKCGHVGKRKYVDVAFAVYSDSKKDAAMMIQIALFDFQYMKKII